MNSPKDQMAVAAVVRDCVKLSITARTPAGRAAQASAFIQFADWVIAENTAGRVVDFATLQGPAVCRSNSFCPIRGNV